VRLPIQPLFLLSASRRRNRGVRMSAAPPVRLARWIGARDHPHALQTQRRAVQTLEAYFLRRAPERFAARKEIPARIAFCCTAAAVRPSFLATCPVGVPDFASALRAASSRALQDAPSFGGRRAIIPTPNHPPKGRTSRSYTDPMLVRAPRARFVTCWKGSCCHNFAS